MTVISKYGFIKYLCLMTSGGVDNGVIAFTFENVKTHFRNGRHMETVMGMTFIVFLKVIPTVTTTHS